MAKLYFCFIKLPTSPSYLVRAGRRRVFYAKGAIIFEFKRPKVPLVWDHPDEKNMILAGLRPKVLKKSSRRLLLYRKPKKARWTKLLTEIVRRRQQGNKIGLKNVVVWILVKRLKVVFPEPARSDSRRFRPNFVVSEFSVPVHGPFPSALYLWKFPKFLREQVAWRAFLGSVVSVPSRLPSWTFWFPIFRIQNPVLIRPHFQWLLGLLLDRDLLFLKQLTLKYLKLPPISLSIGKGRFGGQRPWWVFHKRARKALELLTIFQRVLVAQPMLPEALRIFLAKKRMLFLPLCKKIFRKFSQGTPSVPATFAAGDAKRARIWFKAQFARVLRLRKRLRRAFSFLVTFRNFLRRISHAFSLNVPSYPWHRRRLIYSKTLFQLRRFWPVERQKARAKILRRCLSLNNRSIIAPLRTNFSKLVARARFNFRSRRFSIRRRLKSLFRKLFVWLDSVSFANLEDVDFWPLWRLFSRIKFYRFRLNLARNSRFSSAQRRDRSSLLVLNQRKVVPTPFSGHVLDVFIFWFLRTAVQQERCLILQSYGNLVMEVFYFFTNLNRSSNVFIPFFEWAFRRRSANGRNFFFRRTFKHQFSSFFIRRPTFKFLKNSKTFRRNFLQGKTNRIPNFYKKFNYMRGRAPISIFKTVWLSPRQTTGFRRFGVKLPFSHRTSHIKAVRWLSDNHEALQRKHFREPLSPVSIWRQFRPQRWTPVIRIVSSTNGCV